MELSILNLPNVANLNALRIYQMYLNNVLPDYFTTFEIHNTHQINREMLKKLSTRCDKVDSREHPIECYRETSDISRTKSQNLNVSRFVLQLSSPNPFKPGG